MNAPPAIVQPLPPQKPGTNHSCRCNRGLNQCTSNRPDWKCYICQKSFPEGSPFGGCHECDWYVCPECWKNPNAPSQHMHQTGDNAIQSHVGAFSPTRGAPDQSDNRNDGYKRSSGSARGHSDQPDKESTGVSDLLKKYWAAIPVALASVAFYLGFDHIKSCIMPSSTNSGFSGDKPKRNAGKGAAGMSYSTVVACGAGILAVLGTVYYAVWGRNPVPEPEVAILDVQEEDETSTRGILGSIQESDNKTKIIIVFVVVLLVTLAAFVFCSRSDKKDSFEENVEPDIERGLSRN